MLFKAFLFNNFPEFLPFAILLTMNFHKFSEFFALRFPRFHSEISPIFQIIFPLLQCLQNGAANPWVGGVPQGLDQYRGPSEAAGQGPGQGRHRGQDGPGQPVDRARLHPTRVCVPLVHQAVSENFQKILHGLIGNHEVYAYRKFSFKNPFFVISSFIRGFRSAKHDHAYRDSNLFRPKLEKSNKKFFIF